MLYSCYPPITQQASVELTGDSALLSLEHVLKTTHFVNSHFADAVDQSEQSIVTVDQSELSIESAKCEFTKCVVFSTCSIALHPYADGIDEQ